MKAERGFFLPPLGMAVYGAIAAGVVILGLTVALKVEANRLASCKQEFATFQAQVKALGEVAEAKTKAEIDRQAKLLKETEKTSEKLKSDLSASNRRLRDARSGRGFLPAPPAGSLKPSLACFDRPLLESAIRRFDDGISGLVDEGDQNTLRLKLSRDWALEALK